MPSKKILIKSKPPEINLVKTATAPPKPVTKAPASATTTAAKSASAVKHAPKAAAGAKTGAAPKTPKKRDPSKTERNRIIVKMTEDLRAMLPQVLQETGWLSEASLNAVIGGKAAEFMDLHHDQILSAEAYVSLYMKGFKTAMAQWGASTHRENYDRFRKSKTAQKYFMLFLKRSYLVFP